MKKSKLVLNRGDIKGPSPTSVIGSSFPFDDEDPFDYKVMKSTDEKVRAEFHVKNESQSQTHMNHNVPPLSPRYSKLSQTQDLPPKSPYRESCTISTYKASSFRQRRIELAQQRKCTEERLDAMKDDPMSPTRPAHVVLDVNDIRFSESLHERHHDQSPSYNMIYKGEVYHDPEHVDISSSHDNEENSDDDMTIDTVSSLNTNWTSRSNDAFSARSWLPPKINTPSGTPTQQKSRKSLQVKPKANDSVHPPMFVSSKKNPRKQQRESKKGPKDNIKKETIESVNVSNDEYDPEITIQINNLAKEFKTNTKSDINASVDTGRSLFDETEDDVPPNSTNFLHREKPLPETFQEKGNEKSFTVNHEDDPMSLRRKRLSRLLSANPGTNSDNQIRTNTIQEIQIDEDESLTGKAASPKSLMKSLIDISRAQPFDESSTSILHDSTTKSMSMETKLESDLIDVMDRRDADDDRSLVSTKSFMTFATMKTCFTTKPTSPKEVEIAMNRKRNRIRLFHHVMVCEHPHPTSSDDDLYVPCPEVKNCHALSVLVRHVQTCTFMNESDEAVCEIPRCAAYKKVWNHYRRCAVRTFTSDRKECKVCCTFWKKNISS